MFLLGVGNTLLTSSSTLMPQPQCSVTPEPPLTEEEQQEKPARPVQRVSLSEPGSAQPHADSHSHRAPARSAPDALPMRVARVSEFAHVTDCP